MIDHTPSFRRVMAVEDVFLIRTRLQALLEEHPQLTALIRKMPYECSITQPFLQAYFDSEIPGSVKGLILRAVMGDPSLYPEGAASPVGLSYYRRVSRYFVHHPKRPLERLTSDFQKEDIPRQFEKVLGINRGSPRNFLSQFGLVPYLLFRRGRLPPEGHIGIRIKRSDDLSFLRPFYTSRKISKAVCKALLNERATSNAYAIYFDTGDRVLDLRNMLSFLRVFWQQDRSGAKLQNKIPKAVSDYFGLPRTSLLELAFLVDLLPLVHNSVIDRSRLCKETDSLNLLRILDGVSGSQIENLEMLISTHTSQWLMDKEKAETVFADRERGSHKGRIDTGLYFNMDRLLSRSTGRRFVPYYAAINETKLKRQVNAYFRSQAPSFAEQLCHIQRRFSADFKGIRIRDLSNTLFYVWHHTNRGRDRRKILPAVARFALINTGLEQGQTKAEGASEDPRQRQQGPRSEPRYPLLEAFYTSLSRCYLLYPGYSGSIPEDGPVYMPFSIATGYTGLPETIKTTGPRHVAWGQDPYDSSNLPDIEGYESVVPLTPT